MGRLRSIEQAIEIIHVKPGESFFVISDDYARSKLIAEAAIEAAKSKGAEVSWAIMTPRTHSGQEPPKPIAAAMKEADIIFGVFDTYTPDHTNARKDSTEAGARFYEVQYSTAHREDFWDREIPIHELEKVRKNTEELAGRLTEAQEVKITSDYGTDITMSVKGRTGIPLSPLSQSPIIVVPDYAEAAIAPVEGTTNGLLVIDASVQGWNYLLREPLRLTVRKGRVTDVSGNEDEVRRLKEILLRDENASNCAAELGIGTCHLVAVPLLGLVSDYGALGNVHVAVGRNNDIGGQTLSAIHLDLCMTKTRVELDGVCVLEKDVLKA